MNFNFFNLFGKTLTGRNLDACMMYIGKYLVEQEKIDHFFELDYAINSLQQNYGFVSAHEIGAFFHECRNFYQLQKNREFFEINKNAFNKFKNDSKNGLTINELNNRNNQELFANLQSLLC